MQAPALRAPPERYALAVNHRLVAMLGFVLACNRHAEHQARPSSRPGHGSGSAAGSARAADPWGAGATPPAVPPAETPEARKQRAELALARVGQIMPKLARVRDLAFLHEIARAYQPPDEFRAYARAAIAKELPPARAADRSAALFHIGLLPHRVNLAEVEERSLASQAGAYYDLATKRFFLVLAPDNDLMLDAVCAHELTHGLQDQHFDLQKFLPDGDVLDADHLAARRFVVEGDATFTMFVYAVAQLDGQMVTPEKVKLLRAQLDQFADMSPAEMLQQNLFGFGAGLEVEHAKDSLAETPMTVLVPIFDSYLRGAQLAAIAYDRGGWKAIDRLYREPPESTEQVLHPLTKLYPVRDRPRRVTFAALPAREGVEVMDLVMGELQWQIYFAQWNPDRKLVASEGWGGDRVSVIKRPDGRYVARIATVWDSTQDADEMREAYVASLTRRFPSGAGDPRTPAGFDRGDGAGRIFLDQEGTSVVIVDGADDVSALALLARKVHVQ